ncbi:MAG: protein kinase [Myxococcota bacterium]
MPIEEPLPGDTIAGRYTIEHEIGRGGFGVVYRARHIPMSRDVALKVILATYAQKDPTAVERFRREAVLAASLRSPCTIQLFDYGKTDEGMFYIAMELLHGRSLAEVLVREQVISPARTVHIARQVLQSLMEAHEQDIIHRDIKPENIMLCPLPHDPNFVKVMDFGIAKMVGHGLDITQAGRSYGTPRYMPPEQLRGGDLSPATDVYAVGLVMYEMLTGRPAFPETDLARLLNQVARSPSARLEPANTHLNADLCAIVNRAIEKDISRRYPSTHPMLDELAVVARNMGLDSGGTVTRPAISGQVVVGSGAGELAQTMSLDAPNHTHQVASLEGLWWGLCIGLTAVAAALLIRFWRLSRRTIEPHAEP